MSIDEIKYGELKQIANMFNNVPKQTSALPVGSKVFIRTVTHAFTGLVKSVSEREIVLTNAAWIADTGRYTQAMATGKFSEVEPYPPEMRVIINHEAVIDKMAVEWDLPTEQV